LERIESQLAPALERAAQSIASFDLAIEGTGAFPPRSLPKVLWLGITDSSGALAYLQQRLETECARENFPHESRRFHPHLTIARLRTPTGARELAETHTKMQFKAAAFNVSQIVLVRSEMEFSGSRYTIISRHELKAND
jgi:2'-5' RNA ligase